MGMWDEILGGKSPDPAYGRYTEWWLDQKPRKEDYTSPIFPDGFDKEGYEEDMRWWRSKEPLL